jgi:hypothetical protein
VCLPYPPTAPGNGKPDEAVEAMHNAIREELGNLRQRRAFVDTELRKRSVKGHLLERRSEDLRVVKTDVHIVEARVGRDVIDGLVDGALP